MNLCKQNLLLIFIFLIGVSGCTYIEAKPVKYLKSNSGSKHKQAHQDYINNFSDTELMSLNDHKVDSCALDGANNIGQILILGDSHVASENFYEMYKNPPSLFWIPPGNRLSHGMQTGNVTTTKNLYTKRSDCKNEPCYLGGFDATAIDKDAAYIFKLKNYEPGTKLNACLSFSDAENDSNTLKMALLNTESPLAFKIQKDNKFYGGVLKLEDTGSPLTVIGMNGAKNEDILNWILSSKEIIKLINPKYIILVIGTNDIYDKPYNQNLIYEQISSSINELQQAVPTTKIVLVSPPPLVKVLSKKIKTKKRIKTRIVNTCKALAQDFQEIENDYIKLGLNKNLIFYNWREQSSDRCNDYIQGTAEQWKPDGVHLTSEGYKIFHKKLFDYIYKETQDEIFNY
ncbi:SGNH hydrolase-type esterase domain containing protein [Candidatus Methylopumilus universalis]|uniref:SGNH/GDSL hydrolase family protein n=1 Tax=Candidatus Methylopumilus universalis TaxID=2588536 RepID=UPI003BEF2922